MKGKLIIGQKEKRLKEKITNAQEHQSQKSSWKMEAASKVIADEEEDYETSGEDPESEIRKGKNWNDTGEIEPVTVEKKPIVH